MRVVSGIYRHRELKMSDPSVTRPTKDMVKEGFFSALGEKVNNAVVLDLFAGSGALGIEALSRGAKYAYFIDNDKKAIKTINENINNLNIKNVKVIMSDYLVAINRFINNTTFDVVILDPPYKNDVYETIVKKLIDDKLLNSGAVIVLESDYQMDIDIECKKIKNYKYGKTFITILWL